MLIPSPLHARFPSYEERMALVTLMALTWADILSRDSSPLRLESPSEEFARLETFRKDGPSSLDWSFRP